MKKSTTIHMPNMTKEGPLIEVLLDLPRGTIKQDDGTEVPMTTLSQPFEPIKAIALIDTGASDTTMSISIAEKMGLTIFNQSTGTNILGTSEKFKHSAVRILIPAEPSNIDISGEIIRMPLEDKPFDILIGRNLLDPMKFTYNGKEKCFTLEFEKQDGTRTKT